MPLTLTSIIIRETLFPLISQGGHSNSRTHGYIDQNTTKRISHYPTTEGMVEIHKLILLFPIPSNYLHINEAVHLPKKYCCIDQ